MSTNEELRAAAARLRKVRAANEISDAAYVQAVVEVYGPGDNYGEQANDEGLVIDAYLSQCREDDEEPLTHQLVRPLLSRQGPWLDLDCGLTIYWSEEGVIEINDTPLPHIKTIGQLRRLAACLGVELREG